MHLKYCPKNRPCTSLIQPAIFVTEAKKIEIFPGRITGGLLVVGAFLLFKGLVSYG